jgi:hypothetical protein
VHQFGRWLRLHFLLGCCYCTLYITLLHFRNKQANLNLSYLCLRPVKKTAPYNYCKSTWQVCELPWRQHILYCYSKEEDKQWWICNTWYTWLEARLIERRSWVLIILALYLLSPGRNVRPEADILCVARIYLKRPRLLHSLYFKTLVIVYNRSGISRHVKYAVGKVSLCKKKKLNQESLI